MKNRLGCAAILVVMLLCLATVVLGTWDMLRQVASIIRATVPAAVHGDPTSILLVVAALVVILVLILIVRAG